MGVWIVILAVPLPGLLLTCVPIRRARKRAFAVPEARRSYLIRVILLAAVPVVLVLIAIDVDQDHPNSPDFWKFACLPGLIVAGIRLALEARHARKLLFDHVG